MMTPPISNDESSLDVTIDEYLTELDFTERKRLLVEGPTDQEVLEKLLILFLERQGQRLSQVLDIDTAERIDAPGIRLNQRKVRAVFSRVAGLPCEAKLIGFVDREYYGFGITDEGEVVDEVGMHVVNGRLVWSRGHSIENYFFNLQLLKEIIFTSSTMDLTEAIDSFERYFDQTLLLALALSWTIAKTAQKYSSTDRFFERSISTLYDGVLSLHTDSIDLDREVWEQRLNQNFDVTITEALVKELEIWITTLNRTKKKNIPAKWACHGHIAARLLSMVFASCVSELGEKAKSQKQILNMGTKGKIAGFAATWARLALEGQLEYPIDLLRQI